MPGVIGDGSDDGVAREDFKLSIPARWVPVMVVASLCSTRAVKAREMIRAGNSSRVAERIKWPKRKLKVEAGICANRLRSGVCYD